MKQTANKVKDFWPGMLGYNGRCKSIRWQSKVEDGINNFQMIPPLLKVRSKFFTVIASGSKNKD